MKMNLYLDIDGVLLTKKGEPAKHLLDFLKIATKKFDCYWLTSHCKGDSSSALSYLKNRIPEEAFELAEKIKPTNFNLWKTEGIDFNKDFIWLDDYVFDGERIVLDKNNVLNKLILIDLKSNENQLLEVIKK